MKNIYFKTINNDFIELFKYFTIILIILFVIKKIHFLSKIQNNKKIIQHSIAIESFDYISKNIQSLLYDNQGYLKYKIKADNILIDNNKKKILFF